MITYCASCIAEVEGDDWFHAKGCPVAKELRDSYCTPVDLAVALGRFTLDPCSNPRSVIVADRVCSLETGTDGLACFWHGEDVFVNGPFSDLLPWAAKLVEARSFVFLCNTDHSTKWWKAAVQSGGCYRFDLDKRQQFIAPPHIRSTTNNKPQSLLCDLNAYNRILERVSGLGRWWLSSDRRAA